MEKNNEVERNIKDAAYKIFVARGYDGATMRDIAKEANINSAMLHYYFRSKDNLFDAVLADVVRWFSENVFSVLSTSLSVFDKITKIIERYIDTIRANPLLPNFIFNEINRNPKRIMDKVKLNATIQGNIGMVYAQIIDEMEKGTIRKMEPIHLVFNITSMCIFPFLVKPLIKEAIEIDEDAFNAMLDERKKILPEFVINAIRIPEVK